MACLWMIMALHLHWALDSIGLCLTKKNKWKNWACFSTVHLSGAFLRYSSAVGLQLLKMSSVLMSNGDQPLYENFRKVLLRESLPSLIVSYQLNIGQLEHLRHLLDILEHLGRKSNLKKMFTVMLWEPSQSPTLCFLSVQFPEYTGLLNGNIFIFIIS